MMTAEERRELRIAEYLCVHPFLTWDEAAREVDQLAAAREPACAGPFLMMPCPGRPGGVRIVPAGGGR